MKKSLRIAASIAILLTGLSESLLAQHNYYWRGNTGNWSTGTWLRESASPLTIPSITLPAQPTANDNVIFDGSSFSGNNQTITVNAPVTVASMRWSVLVPPRTGIAMNISQPLTITGDLNINSTVAISANAAPTVANPYALTVGGTLTFAATGASLAVNQPVALGGSLTLAAATNVTGSVGPLTFTATSRVNITSRSAVFNMPVVFNGAKGQWILQDNLTIAKSARFLNGHVVALPGTVANPVNPNVAPPPTNPTKDGVTGTPKFILKDGAIVAPVSPGVFGSNVSHVIGYLEWNGVSSKSNQPRFVFPIGDGTYYRPFTSEQPSTTTNLLARYMSTNPVSSAWKEVKRDAPLNSVSNKEFWYFNSSGSSAPSITLTASHPDPAISEYYRFDRWQGLTLAGLSTDNSKPPTATWSDLSLSAGGVTATKDPATGATIHNVKAGFISNSVNWITFGRRGVTPMPVRLVSFTGQQLDGQVQLKWQSAEEKNTSHFEVERSADGKNFAPVLTKKAQGNSATLVTYNAIDNSPLSGTSYYRLKMVDLDGTFQYSNLVAVSADGTLVVRAYPNPSKGNALNITAGDGRRLVLKSVRDLFGKQVSYQAGNAAGEALQISFNQPLPAGFYVATLAGSDNGELVKVKFVVQ